ncbi:AEC family transporter [Thermodesulforhabdus norvegica]|uniref:AEC family transporter n=1 Tax=Thermodesulforhabdus norvegica TaxID=39841 RepID=A0A1I4SDL0_9BACT|nr:AEC family transporter [Thermodesulforhabdus norvegica]SFM62562.1 hypothetical protein SAMN05660836_00906 [Thermodesulforhabdus norvegica]
MEQIILNAIIPVFSVISLGYALRRFGIVTEQWIEPANTVTYYVAIPAVMFRALAKQDLSGRFALNTVLVILGSLLTALLIGLLFAKLFRLDRGLKATYLHASVHGNIGYMAYAVAYYALGREAFQDAVFYSSILILAQNILAVLIFTLNRKESIQKHQVVSTLLHGICLNPIIWGVCVGTGWSLLRLPVPSPMGRFIDILASMGLPMALLLIGAGLTFSRTAGYIPLLATIGITKLILMPLVGMTIGHWVQFPSSAMKPMVVLLGAPTATVTYVMAREFKGDASFASVAISAHTVLCALTYSLWFAIVP